MRRHVHHTPLYSLKLHTYSFKRYTIPPFRVYACARYEQITGLLAPIVADQRLTSKGKDREARTTISAELGHGRLDALNSYIGSSR